MGLFSRKGKPSYVPLMKPSPGTFALPDINVLRRDAELVSGITEIAMENVKNYLVDLSSAPLPPEMASQRSGIAEIEGAVIARWQSQRPDLTESDIVPTVKMHCRLGWMIAQLENKSGIARADQTESHYQNALMFGRNQLEVPKDQLGLAWLSSDAGYYFGRTADQSIVRSIAEWPAD